MRNINLEIESYTLEQIELVTGRNALHQAIGYLSQWASGSDLYAYACITGWANSSGVEIVASYRAELGGPLNYQIGAVWHPASADKRSTAGHFGFHS